MHDLIQDMGREVVRQDASSNLGKHSRLWNHEDILDVLTGNSGTDSIEGILFDPPSQERVEWNGAAFKKMNNLRILIVRNACFLTNPKYLPNNLRWLDWEGYPSEAFPIGFYPRNIATLKLHGSCLKLSNPFPKFEKLTLMDFSSSQLITKIPDLSGVPNIKEMNFYDCKNLVEVHDSIAFHTKLLDLNLEGCSNLKIFPHGIQMTSLKWLNLNGCTRLQKFPEILGKMDDLYIVDAKRTTFKQFPHSIGHLKGLSGLYVSDNHDLKSLPESIKQLDRLRNLDVKNCKRLQQISRIPPNLQIISADNCSSLTSQSASVIWSQVLKAIQNLVAFMPRTLIPNWFDHCCEGGVLSFWARGKLPDFVFAVVLSKSTSDISSLGSSFTIECSYNGYRTVNARYYFANNDGGVFIVHLHNRTINSFSVGWNYVEIRCKSQANFMIEECGVYVYKQEIKREDIRFDNPFPDHSNIMSIMSRNDRELRLSFQRRIPSADELLGTPVPFVENEEQRMNLERRMDVEQLTWLREFKALHLTSSDSSSGALPSSNMNIEIPIRLPLPMTKKKEQLSRVANQDTKITKRSYTVYMSRKDEELDKPRKKSRIYRELEARKLKRRFIKRSPKKMIEIRAGWRRQVFPPFFFSKFFKLSSRFHAI
ncbi:hypothetical protein L6164_017247 [Bauhinia variegata]|uniref:Uncharacterized protein n=1 Tax=Bauhinia variegata TaxID=167791 RepID=A0ACB9N8U6_BAUVA|nr:hypothetical protein L6164_017247 [Bauhinia variegata]